MPCYKVSSQSKKLTKVRANRVLYRMIGLFFGFFGMVLFAPPIVQALEAEAPTQSSALSPLISGFWISWPLMVGGILHMIVVKLNLLSVLNRPISKTAFGSNKTWRGFVVMPLGTLVGMASLFALPRFFVGTASGVAGGAQPGPRWPQELLQFLTHSGLAANPVWIALGVGLAYVLFELPNSWIKRRLGVAPGELPQRRRVLFAAGDQLDSTLGCALAYAVMTRVNWLTLGVCLFLGPAIHLSVNLVLYGLGIRKRPL